MSIRSHWRQIAALLWVAVAIVVSLGVMWRLQDERRQREVEALTPAPAAGQAKPDYTAALAAALKRPDAGRRELEFGIQLREWAGEDPEAALTYVRRMPRGPRYTQGLLIVLDALGRKDESRALQVAGELVTTRAEQAFYAGLFERMAGRDPAAAATHLAAVPEGGGRAQAVRAIAEVWTARDSAAAFAWSRQLREPDRTAALESHLAILADTAPREAIEHARQALDGPARERAISRAIQHLMLTDPKAAAGLVSLLPPGELQMFAAIDVAHEFGARDPQAALAWLKTLPEGEVQRLALNNLLSAWGATDGEAAGNYVAAMEPGPAQDAAAAHLAAILTLTNPRTAFTWAQKLPAESARDVAFVSIATAWAQQNASAAARWAGSLPEGPRQQAALLGAISHWVTHDAAGARDFIRTLPPASQRAAAESAAQLLALTDPSATLLWAQTLPDPAARDAAITSAYQRWLMSAPAAARAWLASADISSATRNRLAGPVGP
ncbi:MAG: hypothetical protein JSS11_02500 [Verrucomicrobia bacterium]|nr:hypothetical protein [Verrucomicrobiota bacterium]